MAYVTFLLQLIFLQRYCFFCNPARGKCDCTDCENVWCLYSASYIENVQFLFMLTERNIYSECFVILLQIAIENNTYLGTWRKYKRVCPF